MIQDIFHGPVLGDQLQSCFGPHSRHSGDIVAGIPHQPFEIDDLPRFQALVFFSKGFFIIDSDIGDSLFGEKDLDIVFDQLELIPVPGNDLDLDIFRCSAGKGPDDVIGLVIVHFQGGDPHGLEQLHGKGKLFLQFWRCGFALPFIRRKFFRTECFAGFVKSHQHIVGLDFLEQFQEHIAKAIHRAGVDPFLIGQGRQCKESPVDQAAAVDQKEFFVHDTPSSVLF